MIAPTVFESPWRYSTKALLTRGFRRFGVAGLRPPSPLCVPSVYISTQVIRDHALYHGVRVVMDAHRHRGT